MKNNAAKKIIGGVVLLVLCAATLVGLYLGIFGRNTEFVTIHTENGDEQQALYRQVAFIPNTVNETWQEAIQPGASLGGGYSYTFTFDSDDSSTLNAAAKVLRARANALSGSASAKVQNGAVSVAMTGSSGSSTVATALGAKGDYNFVLISSLDGSMSDPVLTSADVKQAYLGSNGTSVQVQFNSKGAKAYNTLRTQTNGAMLYLMLDGQAVGYASLYTLTDNGLTFTVSDATTAYTLITCIRSGVLPSAGTLTDAGAVEPESNLLNTMIIACAVLALAAGVCLLIVGRAGGIAGFWAILAWIVCFFLLASLIAVNVAWVMNTASLFVIVLCFLVFLLGLLSLFFETGKQVRQGRSAYAACADASRKQVKFLAVLYGAMLLAGVLMMIIFQSAGYGILGRIVSVSALVSFVMVMLFPNLVLGCFAALTGKK